MINFSVKYSNGNIPIITMRYRNGILFKLLYDTGSFIPVFNRSIEEMKEIFIGFYDTGYSFWLTGFGNGNTVNPVYCIPEFNLYNDESASMITIKNLKVVYQPRMLYDEDMVISPIMFSNMDILIIKYGNKGSVLYIMDGSNKKYNLVFGVQDYLSEEHFYFYDDNSNFLCKRRRYNRFVINRDCVLPNPEFESLIYNDGGIYDSNLKVDTNMLQLDSNKVYIGDYSGDFFSSKSILSEENYNSINKESKPCVSNYEKSFRKINLF